MSKYSLPSRMPETKNDPDLQSTLQTVVCNLHEKNSAELEWPQAKLEKDVCSLRKRRYDA